jgi:hypothetical protein
VPFGTTLADLWAAVAAPATGASAAGASAADGTSAVSSRERVSAR